MKNFVEFLKAVYENLPLILTAVAILAGIVVRVRKFFRMSKEGQQATLAAQAGRVLEAVKDRLLSLVSKAEKEWGGGTGKIKKSEVWERLTEKLPALMDYVEKGLISRDVIDQLIEDAVQEMEHLRQTNDKIAAAIEPGGAGND